MEKEEEEEKQKRWLWQCKNTISDNECYTCPEIGQSEIHKHDTQSFQLPKARPIATNITL